MPKNDTEQIDYGTSFTDNCIAADFVGFNYNPGEMYLIMLTYSIDKSRVSSLYTNRCDNLSALSQVLISTLDHLELIPDVSRLTIIKQL